MRELKAAGAIIDLLIPIRIFDNLDHEELAIVVRYLNFVDVSKGEVIFREGRKGNYVCFVAEGRLEVLKTSETGQNVLLTTLTRGASIGEMAILDNLPRSATVKAATDATLITLSSSSFEQILDKHPGVGLKILIGLAKLLSQNLRYTSAVLADAMLPLS